MPFNPSIPAYSTDGVWVCGFAPADKSFPAAFLEPNANSGLERFAYGRVNGEIFGRRGSADPTIIHDVIESKATLSMRIAISSILILLKHEIMAL
jgi:hypothetical protein